MHWIEVYKFDKRLNSTKRPVAAQRTGTYDVVLKRPCSVINPVFLLRTSEKIEALSRNNYLYWLSEDTDNRNIKNFYWIDNVTYTANNQIEITCHRDPFATFASDIKAYNGLVARSSTNYDVTIIDTELLASSKEKRTRTIYEDVKRGPWTNQSGQGSIFGSVSATMVTVGKDGNTIFNFNNNTVEAVIAALLNGSGQWEFGVTDPGQYILSCMLLPFSLTSYSNNDPIPVGNLQAVIPGNYHKISPYTAATSVQEMSFVFVKSDYQGLFGYAVNDFRNYIEKFTKVKIWAPFVGSIDFPAIHLKADKIFGSYSISTVNGQGKFSLRAFYDLGQGQGAEITILTCACNMAIDIPVAQGHTNALQVSNDICSAIGAVGQTISAGVQLGMSGGASAGNALGSVADVGKTGMGILADYASGFQEYTVLGSSGSMADMAGDFIEPSLSITQMDTVTEDINTERGRPKMNYEAVGTSTRFLQMYAPSIDIPGATASEINTINATLASGIYIE